MADKLEESRNIVFILGAGASVQFGPPVMNDFMDKARQLYFRRRQASAVDAFLPPCYETLLAFYERCRASAWALRRNWENIEELYTQADLLRLSEVDEKKKKEAEQRCQRIVWAMWDVYRECDFEPFRHIFVKTCHNVFNANLSPVVITTNYDLLCELALTSSDSKVVKGFVYPGFTTPPDGNVWESLSESDECVWERARPKGRVPVIKLHGSVNWRIGTEDEQKWTALPPWQQATLSVNPTNEPLPAIIPPMLGKMSVARAIAHQWNAAIEAIGSARQILVIGYSFPQTDVFMTRLLTEGLLRNSQLEQFVIADIQTEEEWADRIDFMLGYQLRDHKFYYLSTTAWELFHKLKAPNDTNGPWVRQHFPWIPQPSKETKVPGTFVC